MKQTGSRLDARGIALALILIQLVVKFYVEIPKAYELTTSLPIRETVWALTASWLVLVPLYVSRNRGAYLAGIVLGVLHGILALWVPAAGICNHWIIGPAVSAHGLLIAYFSYRACRSANTRQPSVAGINE